MTKSVAFNSLKEEMMYVLKCMLIDIDLIHKLNQEEQTLSRQEFVDTLILERTIHNDIVLRLNKFTDKRNDTCSLYKVIKDLKKTCLDKLESDLNTLNDKLETFVRTDFQPLKKKRDEKLAHLKIGESFSYDDVEVIIDAVSFILKLIDELNVEKVNYIWSYGKLESEIDLRQKLGLT